MHETPRSSTILLIIGAVVTAVAVALFLNALMLRDFPQAGQDLLSGRSVARSAVAFALVTGLALMLLFKLFRAQGSGTAARKRDRTAEKKATVGEHAGEDAPGEIISDTAGELRSSVEMIQEEIEEILEDDAPADKEHMQSLYEETDRLRKIIDSMEQLSQAQAMARALKKEPVQVEPLLRSVIERTKLAVTDRNVTYSLECEPGLILQGDEGCVSRIIGNIAENAARSIKGSGNVTLAAARKDAGVVFSVRDTGTGIRRSHLSHIYERFFRGTGSGIGMGLSVVKELVDACGGRIDVETAVNKGTTFTVQLPE
ncbi:MAG: HAMP domain-containing histidine kinase [Nitrospirota bacterium]|nr:HAMP domain-containing histidine kinase [Nitrospirota bacterium]